MNNFTLVELSNSLYIADVISTTDYYPFGMPSRSFSSGGYRYGFQGQEKDDEIKGSGNSINYKYRMHDPRLGRFLSIDPLTKDYPHNSPYAFSENRVIDKVELEGLEMANLPSYDSGLRGATKQQIANHRKVTGMAGLASMAILGGPVVYNSLAPIVGPFLLKSAVVVENAATSLTYSPYVNQAAGAASGVLAGFARTDVSGTSGAPGSTGSIFIGELAAAYATSSDQIEQGVAEAKEDFTSLGRMIHDKISPSSSEEMYTTPAVPSDKTNIHTPVIIPLVVTPKSIPAITPVNNLPKIDPDNAYPQMSSSRPKISDP